jgi:hypothetical protein
MTYTATKARVYDRGAPPDGFLDQLAAWGKGAPDALFAPNAQTDVYDSVKASLGPYTGIAYRRAPWNGMRSTRGSPARP